MRSRRVCARWTAICMGQEMRMLSTDDLSLDRLIGRWCFLPTRASNLRYIDFRSGSTKIGSSSLKANPKSLNSGDFRPHGRQIGGVMVSTEILAARRHAGLHSSLIEGKLIIANQQMAY